MFHFGPTWDIKDEESIKKNFTKCYTIALKFWDKFKGALDKFDYILKLANNILYEDKLTLKSLLNEQKHFF